MMDRNISLAGAALNLASVLGFAAAMLFLPVGFSYFFSVLIAWGLVLMLAGFARTAPAGHTIAATCALVFGGMYALCNTIVYFVQLSVVATTPLGTQAAALLDFQQFGMFFSLDLLGYGLMALSTFFAGLALAPTLREETVLRWLLLAHGAFALPWREQTGWAPLCWNFGALTFYRWACCRCGTLPAICRHPPPHPFPDKRKQPPCLV